MKKESIRKTLSKVGLAGLAASVALCTGSVAKAGTSCGKGSCGGKKMEEPSTTEGAAKTSCGAGMKDAETKTDDAATPTDEEATAKKKKMEEEGASSCGKGSCGSK